MSSVCKRVLNITLALILVLSMIPAMAFAAEVRTVYLDPAKGLDANSGLSEAAPVQTVAAAYQALEGASEGKIVLLSVLTLTEQTTFPACDIPVTVTGAGITTGNHLFLGGDTTFENITLTTTVDNNLTYISAEGHDLTIGENVTCASTYSSRKFCLAGRYTAGSVEGADMVIKSGNWNNIFVAGYKSDNTGSATLTMLGGKVGNLLLPTYSGNLEGNITINLLGGTVKSAGVAPNETGKLTGDVDMLLNGVSAEKIRIRRNQKNATLEGTATVTVDGDCSNIKSFVHENSTGKITKTRLVLKSGILAATPCTFDEVCVEIPAEKTLTLKDCDITANTVNSQGKLLFSGKASLTADTITGSLNCDITGTAQKGYVYVTAPAGSNITFPASFDVAEENGKWQTPGAYDDSNFKGLVLRAAKDVTVKLYTGYENGSVVTPTRVEEDDTLKSYYYTLTPGNYRSRTSGTGYYSTSQMIYMSPEEVETLTEHIVTPEKRAGGSTKNNWEETQVLLYTDEIMAMTASNGDISQWPAYADVFTTPWFTESHGAHQQTTQEQMEAFLQKLDSEDDDMYLYSIGKSAYYEHDVWAAFFTTTDLSSADTIEEATALMGKDKVTILYRAQIHGFEPAACESALAMIQRMDGAYGKNILDKLNVIILPRTNPDGAQDYKRDLHDGLEPNGDNSMVTSRELTDFIHLYNLLMPEVVIDGHEYSSYCYDTYFWDSDVLVGAGFNPANTDALSEMSTDMVLTTFDALEENNMSYRCYEQVLNKISANVNRSYASKRGSLSFLLETRGNYAGMSFYPRRIVGQVIAAERLIDYTFENADTVKQIVATERKTVVENGKTYRTDDVVPLVVDEEKHPTLSFPLNRIYQDGRVVQYTYTPSVWSKVSRSRIAPTAYVIPAGAEFTQQVLSVLDKQAISYSYLPAGSTVALQQYTGTVEEADLTQEQLVTFGSGAYVITMAQEGGMLLSCLMEPDVKPTSSFSYWGVIPAVDGKFPIYRYIHDLNADGSIDLADPASAAPEGLQVQGAAAVGELGKITGLDANKRYEYSLEGSGVYTAVSAGATEIQVAPGKYAVRFAAVGDTPASMDAWCTVEYEKLTQCIVYLDGTNGDDTADGWTEDNAVKTFEAAIERLDFLMQYAAENVSGKIIITDNVTIAQYSYTMPAHTYPIVITSKTGSEGIIHNTGTAERRNWEMGGDTTMENMTITLKTKSTNNYLFAGGHKLVIESTVKTVVNQDGYFFNVAGGSYQGTAASTDLTIKSGTWRNIYAGGYQQGVKGDARLSLSGSTATLVTNCYNYATQGNLYMELENVTVEDALYCGNILKGDVKGNMDIVLGKGVTFGSFYTGSQTAGNIGGTATVTVDGADLTGLHLTGKAKGTGTCDKTVLVYKRGTLGTYSDFTEFVDQSADEPEVIRGDMNGDESVSDADAMYLLRYTLFGEGRYPLTQSGDVNGDGTVSDADAMYLLRYTLFGESRYPLH